VVGIDPDIVTTAQPLPPPSYSIEADIDIVAPTCILLSWNLRPHSTEVFNGSRITTIKSWRIVLNQLLPRREREMIDELILPGSRSNITLGPFTLGSTIRAEVYLQKFVTADGRTLEGESSFNEKRPDPTIGVCSRGLPSMYNYNYTPHPQVHSQLKLFYCAGFQGCMSI
jgi:hypothetical protein